MGGTGTATARSTRGFTTLDDAGVSSISLSSDGNARETSGHWIFGSGTYTFSDGIERFLDDVKLDFSDLAFREGLGGVLDIKYGTALGTRFHGPTAVNIAVSDEAVDVHVGSPRNDSMRVTREAGATPMGEPATIR